MEASILAPFMGVVGVAVSFLIGHDNFYRMPLWRRLFIPLGLSVPIGYAWFCYKIGWTGLDDWWAPLALGVICWLVNLGDDAWTRNKLVLERIKRERH